MRRYFLGLVVVLSAIGFTSCEKAMMPKDKKGDPVAVVDELWKAIDKGYGNFDLKKVNWDSVYRVYKPMVNASLDEYQLYNLCGQMLQLFRDPEIKLDAGFAQYAYYNENGYAANYNEALLEKYYWKNYQEVGPVLYTVIDSMAYFHYKNFETAITEDQLNAALKRVKSMGGVKGTIIDIRNTSGGDAKNTWEVLRHVDIPDSLNNLTAFLYQTQYKSGPKHGDYTQYEDAYIDETGGEKYPGRVMVLTNRGCVGAANLLAAGCASFINVTMVGDTTGGGGGLISATELPNGWRIYYPSSRTMSSGGDNVAEGIAPDILLYMQPAEEAMGKDVLIDVAIDELKKDF